MKSLTTIKDVQALAAVADPPSVSVCFQSVVPDYALLFFDHMFSEYRTLKSAIQNPDTIALFESLYEKRKNIELTWSDIYTFDLALVDQRPLENLIRKAYDVRAKYRSIAGQKEFDEYLASKPPDLTTILVAPDNSQPAPEQPANPAALVPANEPPPEPAPPAPPVPVTQSDLIKRVLRADVKYLLSKFYLYYAMLPMREKYRDELTRRAVLKTKWIVAAILVLLVLSFGGGVLIDNFAPANAKTLKAIADLVEAFGPVIGSVVFAGIVGGCVSMLQRIQSAPTEGDALFNLAALTNGWRGLSLSPLYGGIFASLLFVLFAANILQGSAFPRIVTNGSEAAAQSSAAVQTPDKTNPAPADAATPAADSTKPAENPGGVTANPLPAAESQVLKVKEFLKETGPRDGVAFALLMIWSFIAGFAERLVPDTLNRLVAKNEALQGTNS